MFEIGWTEMLVIAIVMIVVVGPKDLPRMLRTFGRFTSKMTAMAGDFRKQFDEALKEAELDDVKTSLDSVRKLDPRNEIRKAMSPMEKAAADVRSGLDQMMKPKASIPTQPASTEPQAAAPLKNGSAVDAPVAGLEASQVPDQPKPLEPVSVPATPASLPAVEPVKAKPKAKAPAAQKVNGATAPVPSPKAPAKPRKPKASGTPT